MNNSLATALAAMLESLWRWFIGATAGASIIGTADWDLNPGIPPYSACVITGSVQVGTPAVIVLNQRSCPHPRLGQLVPIDYRLNMTVDGRTMSGTYIQGPGSVNVESSIALTRQ